MGGGTSAAAVALFRDASPWSLLAGAAAVAILCCAVQILEWAWWAPRRMDRSLRAQGLRGTQYRFFRGDLKEEQRLMVAALSRPVPMDRAHDIVSRVAPLLHRVMEEHGMETTAVLLTWTVVVLSMHPEWQDRAREEVLHVFGQSKPDLNGLNRLKVVTMILNEVLRLYPPVVQINRRMNKKIELGGVMYPQGVILALPLIFIHRDPSVWGDDADKFNPGRFSEGVSKACRDTGAFFPFSWGPRTCIGQNFALLEAKVAISMILQRYVFELMPTYVHAPNTVLALHPQHTVPVRLHRR